MRIKTHFGERSKPSEKREPKKRYYLVFEGLKTEPQYFDGVEKYRDKIGIREDIDLKQTEREKEEETFSNPTHIIRLFEKFMNESLDVEEYLEERNFIFGKGHDKICIIVDRDKESFSEKQYEDVLNRCSEKGYHLYVTNPCFEFWLCLHFEEASKFDCDDEYAKILKNKKSSANAKKSENKKSSANEKIVENKKSAAKKYTYVSIKFNEMNPAYDLKKKTINFESFVDGIDRAIKTIDETERYSSDINELKHTVGSNLGNLIKEIKN
jgi:hypothetical protein